MVRVDGLGLVWAKSHGSQNRVKKTHNKKNMTFNMTGFTAFKMTVVSKSSN